MSVVTLTWREVRLAALAGIDTRIMHLHRGTNDHHGRPSRHVSWEVDIQGALGEHVIAKLFDLYPTWSMNKADTDGDVARLQVRATSLDHGGLIVYDDDPDDAPFVLVVGVPPTFRVPGWMRGSDAKQQRWWAPDKLVDPAYLVPQFHLRSVDELIDL